MNERQLIKWIMTRYGCDREPALIIDDPHAGYIGCYDWEDDTIHMSCRLLEDAEDAPVENTDGIFLRVIAHECWHAICRPDGLSYEELYAHYEEQNNVLYANRPEEIAAYAFSEAVWKTKCKTFHYER